MPTPLEKKRRSQVRGILEQLREAGMPASPFPGEIEAIEFEEMKRKPAASKKKRLEAEEDLEIAQAIPMA